MTETSKVYGKHYVKFAIGSCINDIKNKETLECTPFYYSICQEDLVISADSLKAVFNTIKTLFKESDIYLRRDEVNRLIKTELPEELLWLKDNPRGALVRIYQGVKDSDQK